jgi:hypothetical protein
MNVAAVAYAGAAIVCFCVAYAARRRSGDMPPGYGLPGQGSVDWRRWSYICLFGGFAMAAVTIVTILGDG